MVQNFFGRICNNTLQNSFCLVENRHGWSDVHAQQFLGWKQNFFVQSTITCKLLGFQPHSSSSFFSFLGLPGAFLNFCFGSIPFPVLVRHCWVQKTTFVIITGRSSQFALYFCCIVIFFCTKSIALCRSVFQVKLHTLSAVTDESENNLSDSLNFKDRFNAPDLEER